MATVLELQLNQKVLDLQAENLTLKARIAALETQARKQARTISLTADQLVEQLSATVEKQNQSAAFRAALELIRGYPDYKQKRIALGRWNESDGTTSNTPGGSSGSQTNEEGMMDIADDVL